MYICVCVCVYVRIYVWMYKAIDIYVWMYVQSYGYIQMYGAMDVQMYGAMNIYVQMYGAMDMCMCVCVYNIYAYAKQINNCNIEQIFQKSANGLFRNPISRFNIFKIKQNKNTMIIKKYLPMLLP